MFNGVYCDYDRVAGGPYCDVDLIMKWNDAWISNKDCDGDGTLDRHYGSASYRGSGAWLTNHQTGRCVNSKRKWTYFVKIVAAPTEATKVGDYWYIDNIELGPVIWGDFAVVERISNDPDWQEHGVIYKSPVGPGFGHLTN